VDFVNPTNTLVKLRPEGDARFPAMLPRFRELVH